MAWTVSKAADVATFGWAFLGEAGVLSECEEIRATPGAGKNTCIEELTMLAKSVLATYVDIGEGETTGAVTTPYIRLPVTNIGIFYRFKFRRPVMLTANTALTADADNVGAIAITGSGYVK